MGSLFPDWLREYVYDPSNNVENQHISLLVLGPLRKVRTWHTYFVNGFKFHTKEWCIGKKTDNSGVCVKCINGDGLEDDFYGILNEIIELEYPGEPLKKVVLFSCTWFDPTLTRGRRIHPIFNINEVKTSRIYDRYDPFILAKNANQIYYVSYPFNAPGLNEWSVSIKTRPLGRVILDDQLELAFQQNEPTNVAPIVDANIVIDLVDPSLIFEDVGLTSTSIQEDIFSLSSTQEEDEIEETSDLGEDNNSN